MHTRLVLSLALLSFIACSGQEAFVQVSAGYRSSCGVESTGKIACWGVDNGNDEDFGQVTDAPTEAGFVAVEVGWHHACALREDGERTCWGQDDLGQSSP